MFLDGANWFLENQDENGGWPSNVIFNQGQKKYPKAAEIQPGKKWRIFFSKMVEIANRGGFETIDNGVAEPPPPLKYASD